MSASFERRQNAGTEMATRHVADVQLDAIVFMGRIGHREGAALAILQKHLKVLACPEFHACPGCKTQLQHGHIAGRLCDTKDLAWQGLSSRRVDTLPASRTDKQVTGSLGVAKQMLVGTMDTSFGAAASGAGGQLASEHLAATVAAHALAAGVRQFNAVASGSIEHGFSRLAGEGHIGTFNLDLVCHGNSVRRRHSSKPRNGFDHGAGVGHPLASDVHRAAVADAGKDHVSADRQGTGASGT